VGESTTDVAILGAGFAGTAAAFALARKGIKVTLVDQSAVQSPVYKAEKIERDQAELLRELDLMSVVVPDCRKVNKIACGQSGVVWRILELEEYGCFYHDIVNRLRRDLPPNASFHIGKASAVRASADEQIITLMDGSVIKSRLLVLASGAVSKIQEQLGLKRDMMASGHSLSLGFNVAPCQFPAGAESVTYREDGLESKIDYITLFPVRDLCRVNMFTFWDAKDSRVKEMRDNAEATIARLLPDLSRVTGQLKLTSTVEAVPIHLYRMSNVQQPGFVLLGDAFQSVCPTTGTGLSKCLVDVQTLVNLVPQWLNTPGMGADKVAKYYADERKQNTDANSLSDAFHRKRLCLDRSIPWRLRRIKKYLPRQWAALRRPVAA
jgi:2-polyprenyl-6-methoxyphenol hydroxylase-like FAD-dependent oxidoreductase